MLFPTSLDDDIDDTCSTQGSKRSPLLKLDQPDWLIVLMISDDVIGHHTAALTLNGDTNTELYVYTKHSIPIQTHRLLTRANL